MASARVAPIIPANAPAAEPSPTNALDSFHWLPCKATSEIPVPRFTVSDLLNLKTGTVVQTASPAVKDIPIFINRVPLGWGRFEVVEDRLAIRLTEFA
jgi:flagellar motor switch/type III secretory pathway protein FliN